MRNSRPTNPHGTAFAPKQLLYQRGATSMESSNMYCPSRCIYRTYQCVAANYHVSCGVVYGSEWKDAEVRAYQSPWYRVCTKPVVISKGSYGHGEFKYVLPLSVQIPCLPVRCHKLPRVMGSSIGSRMEKCEIRAYQSPWYPV